MEAGVLVGRPLAFAGRIGAVRPREVDSCVLSCHTALRINYFFDRVLDNVEACLAREPL